MHVRFGDFLLDTATRELLRRGAVVPLPPKTFRLLEVLLEARPRALSKQELHALVWPDVYVSDASLTRLVSDLRRVLGGRGRSSAVVRTVHGFGYAFGAEVAIEATSTPGAPCYLVWGRRLVPLVPGENLLGRDPRSIVPFDSPKVSRRHGRIVVAGGTALVEDLGSKNGTTLGGRRLDRPTALADGDLIGIGGVVLVFRQPASVAPTETELSGVHREVSS